MAQYYLHTFCSHVFVLWLTESIASVYLYVCCAMADSEFAFFRLPDNKKKERLHRYAPPFIRGSDILSHPVLPNQDNIAHMPPDNETTTPFASN